MKFLYTDTDALKEINSLDKSLIEKLSIYTMLDVFIGKQKLKDVLSNALTEVK